MNCLEFDRLLDAGEPERLPAEAHAHTASCARCARSLVVATRLEVALARAFESRALESSAFESRAFESRASGAPSLSSFADAVMARVAAVESRGARQLLPFDVLPWWVRAAAEPPVALACGVAALLLWRGGELLTGSRVWATALAEAARRGDPLAVLPSLVPVADAFSTALTGRDSWAVALGVVLALAPVLAMAGLAGWRLGERFVALVAPARPLPRL